MTGITEFKRSAMGQLIDDRFGTIETHLLDCERGYRATFRLLEAQRDDAVRVAGTWRRRYELLIDRSIWFALLSLAIGVCAGRWLP